MVRREHVSNQAKSTAGAGDKEAANDLPRRQIWAQQGDLLAKAIEAFLGDRESVFGRMSALTLVEQEIRRRLALGGVSSIDDPAIASGVHEGAKRITNSIEMYLENLAQANDDAYWSYWSLFSDHIDSIVAGYGADWNKYLDTLPNYEERYGKLPTFLNAIFEGLIEAGWETGEAAEVTAAFTHARKSGDLSLEFQDSAEAKVTAELVLAGILAAAHINSTAGKVGRSLPPKAPEVWAERDRSKQETPIEFLNRVWEPWLKAGVLYQDDIKRLGDDKLVRAIRSYCQKHPDINASDVLPPPGRARLERALANADPDSAEASALRTRIAMRDSSRRHARKRRRGSAPKP